MYATPREFRTLFTETIYGKTTPSSGDAPNTTLPGNTSNIFGSDLPIDAVALNILHLVLYCARSIVVSILAWLLVFFIISFVLVPHCASQRRPSLRDRLRFCRLPTTLLSTIQLGIALAQPHPTIQYDVKMTGTQDYREVKILNKLAFNSWLATLAVVLTVCFIVAAIASVGDWIKDMEAKKTPSFHIRVGRKVRAGELA